MNLPITDFIFLDVERDNHIWDVEVIQKINTCLETFAEKGYVGSGDKCFGKFRLDFAQAQSDFREKMNVLALKMKCRVKGDNDAHFGGQECAEFARDLINATNQYLVESICANGSSTNSIPYMIRKIRDKATADETFAWSLEEQTRRKYLDKGTDDTLEVFKKAGYEIGLNQERASSAGGYNAAR